MSLVSLGSPMKRTLISIVVLAVLGFFAGFLTRQFMSNIQEIKIARNAPPPRTVPDSWPHVRLSPGHSAHVINQDVECNECHDPAEPTFDAPDTGVCTPCHEERAALAHVDLEGKPMDCYTCHVFKSEPDVFGRWHCTRCHGPFETEGNPGLAIHTSVPCETCHNPHKPTSETVLECDECHQKVKVRHGRPRLSGTCADCHGGHKIASDAASCLECHESREPMVSPTATFAGGHDSCATCHQAHSFSASSALRCTTCHKQTQVLAQNKARAHRDCASCHRPHAVRAAADASCAGCHSDVSSTHPSVGAKGDCISCHEPHPRRITQLAYRCTDCHDEAHSAKAFHSPKTECTDCHQPHAFDLSGLEERALCVRCHATQVRLTSRNEGHFSCESCHGAAVHHLSAPLACATCHEEQWSNSPEGHRECMSCHEPHRGVVSAQTTCTGCHQVAELPGLHRIPDDPQGEGHSDCTACHNVHIPRARADRAACMACHKDIATHEPDAKRCTGCHTFVSGR